MQVNLFWEYTFWTQIGAVIFLINNQDSNKYQAPLSYFLVLFIIVDFFASPGTIQTWTWSPQWQILQHLLQKQTKIKLKPLDALESWLPRNVYFCICIYMNRLDTKFKIALFGLITKHWLLRKLLFGDVKKYVLLWFENQSFHFCCKSRRRHFNTQIGVWTSVWT